MAAAKAEGQIVFIGGPEGSQDDGDWFNAFGKEFGLKVTTVGGPTADETARIEAERAQGVYSVDVGSLGGSGTTNFLKDNFFENLDSQIFLPEALDRSQGFAVDHPVYCTSDSIGICQYVAVQCQANITDIWYNTQKVTAAEVASVKSYNDFLNPEFKGRIVIGNVAAGEADRDATTLWQALGQTWWDTLLGQLDPTVVPYGDERTYADGLTRGEWSIGLFPPGSASLQDAQQSGLPVAEWPNTLAEGNPKSGIQRITLFKNAPHPNAAQLFVNWALTKDGQTAFNQYTNRTDRASIRNDVPQGKIADSIWQCARNPNNPFVDDVSSGYTQAHDAFQTYIKAKFEELHIVPGS